MKQPYNILVVEDDAATAKIITFNLKEKGRRAYSTASGEEGLRYFRDNSVDLVLVDYGLPGMSGEELFFKIKELNPFTPVIFITALKSVDKAVQLLKAGAYSYLTKPLKMDALLHEIDKALEKMTLEKENRQLQNRLQETFAYENYVFNSPKMQQILQVVMQVAGSDSNILITGESGTGKDVIANIIHHCSRRRGQKFVKVNIAALPETLVEAELFGAVKGAYTGAAENRTGKFEEAHQGTLFLDEIGELSTSVQVTLLRVIQDREVTRLGSNTPRNVDIRLITATNKNLEEAIKEKVFREDLFYRLNVIDISLPPLRERKEDIPLLIHRFIKKYNQREGKQVKGITNEAINALAKYSFPGNIRELENIIERALVLCRDDVVGIDELPGAVAGRKTAEAPVTEHGDTDEPDGSLSLPERLTAVEKKVLVDTLEKHHYHQTKAARELGISEARLRYRMRILGIQKK